MENDANGFKFVTIAVCNPSYALESPHKILHNYVLATSLTINSFHAYVVSVFACGGYFSNCMEGMNFDITVFCNCCFCFGSGVICK